MLLFALVVILAVVSVSLAHETGHAHAHAHEHSLLASQIKFSHGKPLHTQEITLKNGEKKTVSRCGNKDPTESELERAFTAASQSIQARGISLNGIADGMANNWVKGKDTPFIVHKGHKGFHVKVRYIVVQNADGSMPGSWVAADGSDRFDFESLVTPENLETQTQRMNEFFSKFGWHFMTDSIVQYKNDEAYSNWAYEEAMYMMYSEEELGAIPLTMACDPENTGVYSTACVTKIATHTGGMDTFNVWITNIPDGILGYATFPFFNAGPLDGVVMAPFTLPNGAPPFGDGKTLVHEAGHWLGLFHTFQGGCSAVSPKITKAFKNNWIMSSQERGGDYVSDTAAEKQPFFGGCGVNMADSLIPDTCTGNLKGFEGKDPIHNVMDYGDDECMTEVTDGQFENMHLFWRAFREHRNSMCFTAPDTPPIDNCMCHSTCGSCGYYDWPIRNNDCITCADGSAVVPEYNDGTGHCNIVHQAM